MHPGHAMWRLQVWPDEFKAVASQPLDCWSAFSHQDPEKFLIIVLIQVPVECFHVFEEGLRRIDDSLTRLIGRATGGDGADGETGRSPQSISFLGHDYLRSVLSRRDSRSQAGPASAEHQHISLH